MTYKTTCCIIRLSFVQILIKISTKCSKVRDSVNASTTSVAKPGKGISVNPITFGKSRLADSIPKIFICWPVGIVVNCFYCWPNNLQEIQWSCMKFVWKINCMNSDGYIQMSYACITSNSISVPKDSECLKWAWAWGNTRAIYDSNVWSTEFKYSSNP